MKLILDETRLLGLSNHINYKSILLVLKEIWFFEIYLEILCFISGSMGCEGYKSPYITRKWVQPIFLESLHIGQHPIKILEFNSISFAPNNSPKLPFILVEQRQGSPIPSTSWAHNMSSPWANEVELVGYENRIHKL